MKHRKNRHREVEQQETAAPASSYTGIKIMVGVLGILLTVAILVFALTRDGPQPDGGIQTAGGNVPTAAAPSAGSQEIRMAVERFSYNPSTITVQAGTPVKWVVDGTSASGCTQYLVSPDFGISRRLQRGENIIEFTPTKKGTYTFTCGMGMVKGTMKVV